MSSVAPKPRPEAKFVTPLPPEAVLRAFERALARPGCPVRGQLVTGHVELFVPPEDQRFWSPWLSLEVRTAVDVTHVRGRFGPHPHVWTGFMAAYAVLALFGILAGMYGWAQILVEEPPLALLGVPAALALGGFLFGAEWIGKGLGTEQMFEIRDFVRSVLEAGEAGEEP